MKHREFFDYLEGISAFLRKREPAKAKHFGEAILKKLVTLTHSPQEEYQLYCLLGNAYSELTEHSRAIDVFYKAYAIALKSKLPPVRIVYASLQLAVNFIMTKNIDQAIRQLQKVLEYYTRYGDTTPPMDKQRYFTAIGDLAYCYLYKGELGKAGDIINRQLAGQQDVLSANHLCVLDYHHLNGEYLIAKGEYPKARQAFEECIRISDEEKFPIGKLEAQIHLAMLLLGDKNVSGAIELLLSLYREAGKLKSNSLMCESALLLSKCYSLKDEPDRSAAMEKQVKALLNKLDTNWLYEKIGEFDRLYQQLQKLYSLRESPKYVPEVLADAMDKHYEANPDKYAIVGNSLAIKEVYHVIDKIAPTDLPILVQGETGTGKELICRLIHQKSARSEKPYLAINCGALPQNLLENELFGHNKGAFTGAMEDKKGYIELASGGTLMLDEVTNMSLAMQQKLLRVLEEQQVWPLGAEKPVPVNTRFIFASNQNVEQMLAKGTLRNDLFYRINVIIITLPPLRERKEDIPLLIEHFLNKYSPSEMPDARRITPDALRILTNYSWPGNVRELENEVQKICVLHRDDKIIKEEMISEHIKAFKPVKNNHPYSSSGGKSLKQLLKECEKNIIIDTIKKYDGNITLASRHLGYDRSGLYRKMKQLRVK